MFRPANNRGVWRQLVQPRDVAFLCPIVIVLALVGLEGCGAKTVKLTIPQLHDLETCVLQDDQVERQNCIERLFPKGER